MLERIAHDIVNAYGSIQEPSWSFVLSRLKKEPYITVMTKLAAFAKVIDSTDVNEDVGLSLSVSDETTKLSLRLSLVGSYACVHDENGEFLNENNLTNSQLGQRLLTTLIQEGTVLLNETDLREPLLFGGEQTHLYEILFSTDELLRA